MSLRMNDYLNGAFCRNTNNDVQVPYVCLYYSSLEITTQNIPEMLSVILIDGLVRTI